MKKKIVMGIATAGTALAMLPMFAAFEAHVINVTAKIENALSVPTDPINFGTVFPQEHLDKFLSISLSQSFLDEPNANDVEYIIRQKPKCGVTTTGGTVLVGPTGTGHVFPGVGNPLPTTAVQFNPDGISTNGDEYYVDCGVTPRTLITGETWGLLPDLCPYISKHDDGTPENDGSLDSFHRPFTIIPGNPATIDWNDTPGLLLKDNPATEGLESNYDTTDRWTIDLAVPCFGGFCAQDWLSFVHKINPDIETLEQANQYTQPIANEHKIFGCNLWVEVTEVSRFGSPTPGSVEVKKVIDPLGNSPILLVTNFDFFVGTEEVTNDVPESFAPGNYLVKEENDLLTPPTTPFSKSISCTGDPDWINNPNGTATIDVDAGEVIVCTITNEETP